MTDTPHTDAEQLTFGRDDNLNEIVSQLQVGDKVLPNDRSIPLEVIDTDVERIGSDPHKTETVYLEGRGGRVYRIHGAYRAESQDGPTKRPPLLELRRKGKWGSCPDGTVSRIAIESDQQILSDTRAGEWLQEAGVDVR